MSKYRNRRVQDGGHTFDSVAEHRRWLELVLMERAGAISALRVHPRYEILPKDGKERARFYEGDFEYVEDGQRVCEDVKGVETQVFRLKASMFRRRYPGIELRVVKA